MRNPGLSSPHFRFAGYGLRSAIPFRAPPSIYACPPPPPFCRARGTAPADPPPAAAFLLVAATQDSPLRARPAAPYSTSLRGSAVARIERREIRGLSSPHFLRSSDSSRHPRIKSGAGSEALASFDSHPHPEEPSEARRLEGRG